MTAHDFWIFLNSIVGWEIAKWADRRYLITQRFVSLLWRPRGFTEVNGTGKGGVVVTCVRRGRVKRTTFPGTISDPGMTEAVARAIHTGSA